METKDELLFIVRAAQQSLPSGINNRIEDTLAFVEGMAPFLDRDSIMDMKCLHCDHHASSFFPLAGDYDVVDSREYCHAKELPFHRLNIFTIARCLDYTTESQERMRSLGVAIIEEDLRPELAGTRLYDRNKFASFCLDFELAQEQDRIFIEFGHRGLGEFTGSGTRLHLVNGLYPGFGSTCRRISEGLKVGPVMVVEADEAVRRTMAIQDILAGVGEKRKMKIVYL